MIKSFLNAAALVMGLMGVVFKANWWAGADVLIFSSLLLLFVSIVVFTLGDNAEAGVAKPLNFLMVGTLALGVVAAIFRILQWEGAAVLSFATVALLLLLSFWLLVSQATLVVSRQFLTVAMVLFTLFFASVSVPTKNAPADVVAVEAVTPE